MKINKNIPRCQYRGRNISPTKYTFAQSASYSQNPLNELETGALSRSGRKRSAMKYFSKAWLLNENEPKMPIQRDEFKGAINFSPFDKEEFVTFLTEELSRFEKCRQVHVKDVDLEHCKQYEIFTFHPKFPPQIVSQLEEDGVQCSLLSFLDHHKMRNLVADRQTRGRRL